jgi:hypothetical protein
MLDMTRVYDHYTRVEYDTFFTTHKFRHFHYQNFLLLFGFYCNGNDSLLAVLGHDLHYLAINAYIVNVRLYNRSKKSSVLLPSM